MAMWLWWLDAREHERTDNAFLEADLVAIGPRLDGWIAEVPVMENRPVRAGDVLVRLDDRELEARQAEQASAVAVAKASRVAAESRAALQAAFIREAEAAVDGAQAELARAEAEHARTKALLSGAVASRRTLDTTEAERRKAAADLDRATAALAAARDQRGVLAATAAEAAARLSQAEAALAALEVDRANLTITAPADGIVGHVTARSGEYARAGRQLMVLVQTGTLHVVANFKETQIARMRPGQPVTMTVDALPDVTLTGRVDSFAPASGALFSILRPENATGNFTKVVQRVPVRIALDGGAEGAPKAAAELLRPGLSVVVRVRVGDR